MKSLTVSFWLKKIRHKLSLARRHFVTAASCFLIYTVAPAQTLFTYGKHAVSKEEFLRAYNKNNNDSNNARMSYSDYLDLYSKFKMKVQSALDAHLDTTQSQKAELESFRYQLSENYLKDDATVKLLIDEAFERSKKDIHVSYIFIPLRKDADTATTRATKSLIEQAYERLENEPFEKVATSYENGTVGFISVFALPYDIENVVYSLEEGKYSEPFQTASGFYIVKNNKERKAVGQIRVAQILLAFSPATNDEEKKKLASRADSIYNALQKGANFAELARQYSNDNLTWQNGGEMPVFGLGQYDTVFTEAAFSLQKDGDVGKPVLTRFGYHIIKRLEKIDVIEDRTNTGWMDVLREKVMQSDRIQSAQKTLIKNVREVIGNDAAPTDLSSDSAALDYYRRNLEKYNPEFAEQMKEFKEGNLLFGIMQKKVWDAAVADSAALRNYYNTHKDKYNWENSADAIIVTCTDSSFFQNAVERLKNNMKNWRQWPQETTGGIQADSARFEISQIPVPERTNFTEGLITAPVVNQQDNSITFAYIIRLYNDKSPKKFEDAKGTVINDYQTYLEEQWIAELKKKYPLKINRKVFNSLPKTS